MAYNMQNVSKCRYSLRWEQHYQSIVNDFGAMCREEELVDVTLRCEGRKIRAHKVLLAACSPYFRNVFKENPCQHSVIIFQNVRYCDLAAIVEFIYQGQVTIAQDQVTSFFYTAKTLSIRGLTDDLNQPQQSQQTGTAGSSSSTIQQQQLLQIWQQNLLPTSSMLRNVTPYPTSTTVSSDQQQQPTIAEMQTEQPHEQLDQTQQQLHQVHAAVQQLLHNIQQVLQSQQSMQGMQAPTQQQSPGQITDIIGTQDRTAVANQQGSNTEILGATKTTLTDAEVLQAESENSSQGMRRFTRSLKPEKFQCFHCGKNFAQRRSLNTHHKDVHSGRTQCTICGRILCSSNYLRKHMLTVHEKRWFAHPVNPNIE
ncbi:longitudinals lacking protein, isoforms H/M/V-like [Anopheles albimanus]|uniref:longitudinals lacking protein, isoforms H/M/V-like n=1 Tax=Anopheles albimanus TaxID=7167 RepID=UPI00163EA24C|nr:longitudinals lacking protein, isoforms H/M/V-like [Anopheles albimanus]